MKAKVQSRWLNPRNRLIPDNGQLEGIIPQAKQQKYVYVFMPFKIKTGPFGPVDSSGFTVTPQRCRGHSLDERYELVSMCLQWVTPAIHEFSC